MGYVNRKEIDVCVRVDPVRPSSPRIILARHRVTFTSYCVLTLFVDRTPHFPLCRFPSHPASRSTDWVQKTTTATTKWGDIGDWDVSGVGDFSHAFSTLRNKAGDYTAVNGNPKAATFVGTAICKWTTTSATSLLRTFALASEMNSDLSKWSVAKVTTLLETFSGAIKFAGVGLGSWDTTSLTNLQSTFHLAGEMNSDLSKWNVAQVTTLQNMLQSASKFTGTGLPTWDIAKVTKMEACFNSATSITSCSKRRIADAWKSNSAFATWNTAWVADKCPLLPLTDTTFKQASWGT